MKKITIALLLLFATLTSYSQNKANDSIRGYSELKLVEKATSVYILYPTTNIYTFIKLNTRNGKLWQVQWHFDESKRFESVLDVRPCVSEEDEFTGRFTLYPTQNMYNFILLDQVDGRMWQVQWSTNCKDRLVFPIH